jgi:hypothetical protein
MCRYHTRECNILTCQTYSRVFVNHTMHVKSHSASGNRTLRVEINLIRVEITLMRVVFTLICVKVTLRVEITLVCVEIRVVSVVITLVLVDILLRA